MMRVESLDMGMMMTGRERAVHNSSRCWLRRRRVRKERMQDVEDGWVHSD